MCIAETSAKPSRMTALPELRLDLVGDVDDFLAAFGLEPEVVSMGSQVYRS
jgi:hypothetical protein